MKKNANIACGACRHNLHLIFLLDCRGGSRLFMLGGGGGGSNRLCGRKYMHHEREE